MLVRQIMRSPVTFVTPDTSVRAAAALMKEMSVGMLPVCAKSGPVGIVTDRDIAIRWAPNAVEDGPVSAIMSPLVHVCRQDEAVEKIAHFMGDTQIRRLLVLDEKDRMVGVVTLGDIARDASEELAGQALGEIVECR